MDLVPHHLNILYVDDEPLLLDLVTTFLGRKHGLFVDTAISAHEALEKIGFTSYDAVVSDYQMPEMDGLRFLQEVRSRTGDLPFILFTGHGREEVAIEAINLGVDFYIQKGGDPAAQFTELNHKIRQAIRRRRAEEALMESEERFRGMAERSEDLILILDVDMVIRYVSPSSVTITGYPPEELRGRVLDEVVKGPSGQERVLQAALNGTPGNPGTVLVWVVRKDRNEALLEVRATAISEGGESTGFQLIGRDITERFRSEEKLREACLLLERQDLQMKAQLAEISMKEEFLAGIFSGIQDGISVSDTGMTIVRVNPALERWYSQAMPLVGRKCYDVYQGRTAPCEDCPAAKTLKTGEPGYSRVPLVDRGLTVGWLDLYSFPWMDRATGRIIGVIEYVRDVTARKKAEEHLLQANEVLAVQGKILSEQLRVLSDQQSRLEESENLVRTIIRASPIGMLFFETGPDGRLLLTGGNPAGDLVLGSPHTECLGKSLEETCPWIFDTTVPVCFPDIASGAAPGWHDPALVNRRGPSPAVCTVWAFQTAHNHLAVMVLDITVQKRQEEAIRENAEWYRRLITRSFDAIFIHRGGIVLFANDVCATLLGAKSPEDLAGRPVFELVHPDERLFARERFLRMEKDPSFIIPPFEERLVALDGRTIDVEMTLTSSIYDGAPAFQALFRDISGRKRIEHAIKRVNTKLNLLSSITRHDMSNTLSLISGWLAMLEDEVTTPLQHEYLGNVVDACGILKSQVAFTRQYQELGVREPRWHRITRTGSDPGGIRVVYDPSAEHLEVFADPLFTRVIGNLIDNTRRHGETATTIRFSGRLVGGDLELVVGDDGTGVPADQKEKIFEPNFGKNQGLGLFLCREILSVTGMMIRETGTPGTGACFVITVRKGNFRYAAG